MYIRFVLDAGFERRIRSEGCCYLSTAELEMLWTIPEGALRVERRGRRRHLWRRLRAQLPLTTQAIDERLAAPRRALLEQRLFEDSLWDGEHTLNVPPFGQSWELGSPLLRAIAKFHRETRELLWEFLFDLTSLELARFASGLPGAHRSVALHGASRFDLRRACSEPAADLSLLLGCGQEWTIEATGRVRIVERREVVRGGCCAE